MPVRKSDLLRARCCSGKPRLHGRTKGPSSVPRIRALHDAKSGGRKAGGGIGCPRGTGELPHWTSRSRLEYLESVRYDSATWGQIPNKEGPRRVRGANLHLRWVSPPEQDQGSRQKPWILNHYFVIRVKNSFQNRAPINPTDTREHLSQIQSKTKLLGTLWSQDTHKRFVIEEMTLCDQLHP